MGAETHTGLSPEEQLRRTRVCLFEVGFHDIDIAVIGQRPDGQIILGTTAPIGMAIGWQVGSLLAASEGERICCYACYVEEHTTGVLAAHECRDGHCHNPKGPARPPRSELRGRP